MSKIEELRRAIAGLSLEERAELLSSLNSFEDDDWDRQMRRDAAAGKFDALNNQAEADLAAGETKPLEELLGEP